MTNALRFAISMACVAQSLLLAFGPYGELYVTTGKMQGRDFAHGRKHGVPNRWSGVTSVSVRQKSLIVARTAANSRRWDGSNSSASTPSVGGSISSTRVAVFSRVLKHHGIKLRAYVDW